MPKLIRSNDESLDCNGTICSIGKHEKATGAGESCRGGVAAGDEAYGPGHIDGPVVTVEGGDSSEAGDWQTLADQEDAPPLYDDLTFGDGEVIAKEDGEWLTRELDSKLENGVKQRKQPGTRSPRPQKLLPLPIAKTFAEHRNRWCNCQGCALSQQRSQVVLAKGQVPADVVFVGQGPGDSEDAMGIPLCGPAGHRQDYIESAAFTEHKHLRRCHFNLIGCIPRDAKAAKARGDRTDEEPEPVEIIACADRFREMVSLARPKLVVLLGALAKRWWPKLVPDIFWEQIDLPIPTVVSLPHPAGILRIQNDMGRELATKAVAFDLRARLRKTFPHIDLSVV